MQRQFTARHFSSVRNVPSGCIFFLLFMELSGVISLNFFFFWSWPNQFQSFKIHAGFGRFRSACSRTCCDEFMYLFKPSSPDKLLKDSETLLNTYQRLQKLFCLIQVPVKPTEDHCLSWVLDDDFILACELHNRKYYSLLEFEKRKQ